MDFSEIVDLMFQVLFSRIRRDGHCELSTRQLKPLIKKATKVFGKEPSLLRLDGDFVIVGDLHGNVDDLIHIFQVHGYPPDTRYVLLGDYVDRGRNSIETLIILYALKVKFPDCIYLIRGNHEVKNRSCSGFHEDCILYLNKRCYALFCKSFAEMPVAAVLNKKIFCVHGGISQYTMEIEEIEKIEKPLVNVNDSIASDLLWSDPSSQIERFTFSSRGNGYLFGNVVLDEFLADNHLTMMIRAHQFCNEGFKWSMENCLTVFSASDYVGMGNRAGIAILKNEEVKTSTFTKSEYMKIIVPQWIFEESKGIKPTVLDERDTYEEVEIQSSVLIL